MGEKARERVPFLSLSRTPSPSSFFALAVLPANLDFRVAPQLVETDTGGTETRKNRVSAVGSRLGRASLRSSLPIFTR